MDMACPVCNKIITLAADPANTARLIGECGHFPGGPLRRVIDIPNTQPPEAEAEAVPVQKIARKGVKAK
jgi:hypothetical protein